MVGKDRYLKKFRDINGIVPKKGDDVVIMGQFGPRIEKVLGIYIKFASYKEGYHQPFIMVGQSYNQLSVNAFNRMCFILDENKQVIWQFKK